MPRGWHKTQGGKAVLKEKFLERSEQCWGNRGSAVISKTHLEILVNLLKNLMVTTNANIY